jgi:predicted RNA binding protein YcfA (HicA-like mRNA interferase family)
MKLPRDVSGAELVAALGRIGYRVTRQVGSHVRVTTALGGEHHVTVPDHSPIKVGTLNSIIREVAGHAGISRDELLARLFE